MSFFVQFQKQFHKKNVLETDKSRQVIQLFEFRWFSSDLHLKCHYLFYYITKYFTKTTKTENIMVWQHFIVFLCQFYCLKIFNPHSHQDDKELPLPMFVDNKSGIKFVTSSTLYYACNMGQKARCLYALCDECYQSKYPANKRRGTSERIKEEKSPMEKARHTCCHGKHNLQARSDLW